jgi:hypothetical protein
MSEQNDEVVLAHIEYLEKIKVDVSNLPAEIIASVDKIDDACDKYEAEPTDALLDKIEADSRELKTKIEAWHTAQKPVEPKAEPKVEPKAETKTEPTPTPAAKTEDEGEEESGWGLSFLKW